MDTSDHDCRKDMQYKAALKRVAELEVQHGDAWAMVSEHRLALQQKDAALVAARQNMRSTVAEAVAGVASGQLPWFKILEGVML